MARLYGLAISSNRNDIKTEVIKMAEKVKLCYGLILVILGLFIGTYKLLNKKIAFRPFVAGTVIAVVTRQLLVPAVSSILAQVVFKGLDATGIILIQSILGPLLLTGVYLLVARLYIGKEQNSITAFSLAFGEGATEFILQYGYMLLSYAVLFNSIVNGDIEQNLLSQGYSQEVIPTYIAYLESTSVAALIGIFVQGLIMYLSQFLISCALYRFYQNHKYQNLLTAFAVSLCAAVVSVIVPYFNLTAGLVLMVAAIIGYYCYVVAVKNNLLMDVYQEKDVVERKKKERK